MIQRKLSAWMRCCHLMMKRQKKGRELRLPGLLYEDDLVLCCELKDDLRVMMGHFVEVCRRGLKVNAVKSKVMVLNGEEGFECYVYVDRIHLELACFRI